MPYREATSEQNYNHRQPTHDHFLFEGLEFPALKQDLVDFATDALTLDVDTMNVVRALPDRTYTSRNDIWRAWGEAARRFGSGALNLGQPRDDIGKQATDPKA